MTDEERKLVFKRKAVWNSAVNKTIDPNTGREVDTRSAVWKSLNPKTGKVTYVTHTHRAYNTASTIKGVINRFHRFIKGTA